MKSFLLTTLTLLLAVVAARADVTINSTNFPDAAFRNYLLSEYPSGTITTAQLNARTTLEVTNLGISNMKGVEYFTELTRLSCYYNNLTTIDVSSNTKLIYLNVYRNKLTSITGLDKCTVLEQLYLHYNQLTSVSVNNHSALRTLWVNQNPNLTSFTCYRNVLTNVDVTGCTSLKDLRCYENPNLVSINGLADCTKLTYLDCEDCYFTDLSAVNGMSGLETLLARNNKLTSLNVKNKRSLVNLRVYGNTLMTSLNCDNCALTSLDISNCSSLTTLNCSNNSGIATITGLSACMTLKELVCYSCSLTDLSVLNNLTNIERVVCSDNYITKLTVSNKSQLWQLAVDDNPQLTELRVFSNSALTILNVTGCTALETMYCYNNYQLPEIEGLADCKESLKSLSCHQCALTSLDMTDFTSLTKLSCFSNNLTYLNVANCGALTDLKCYYNHNLQTINGLSSCTALTYIDCEDCAITSLTALSDLQNLTHIYARNNQLSIFSYYGSSAEEGQRLPLTTLRLLGNVNLTDVECYNTNLSDLNVSGCTALQYLFCNDNRLTSLDISTLTNLSYLNCNANQLTELDISHCPELVFLWCNQNQLTSLDLSNCSDDFYSLDCRINNIGHTLDMSRFSKIYQLACSGNQIPQLTLGGRDALTDVWCDNNQLSTLDVSNSPLLRYLDAQSNQLTSLNVSGCTALEILYAHGNELTSLDVSNLSALKVLYAQYNNLTSLRVANCPALYMLPMYYNQIQAGQMGKTVNWLPTRSEEDRGSIYVHAGEHPETGRVDGNVMTPNQVALANDKYWDVYCWNWDLDDWELYTGETFTRGDVNNDGQVKIGDVTALINYLLSGDATGVNVQAADCDQNGEIKIGDVTALINYLLSGNWPATMRKAPADTHTAKAEPTLPTSVRHLSLPTLEAPRR